MEHMAKLIAEAYGASGATADRLRDVQRSEMTALERAEARIAHLEKELAHSERRYDDVVAALSNTGKFPISQSLVKGLQQYQAITGANERMLAITAAAGAIVRAGQHSGKPDSPTDATAAAIIAAGKKARNEN